MHNTSPKHLLRRLFQRALCSVAAAVSVASAHAQIDIRVSQPAPANNSTITYNQTYTQIFALKNLSTTATIPASTNLIIRTYIIKGTVTDTISSLSTTVPLSAFKPSGMPPGDSLAVQLAPSYTNFTQSINNAQYCQSAYMQGNVDPNPANNTACATVNLVYVSPGPGGHNTGTPTYSFFQNSTAQNTIPLANSTSNKAQYIYLPGEIKTTANAAPRNGAKISRLYFRTLSASNTYGMTNVTIRLGHTTATSFTGASFLTGLTQVFNAATYSVSTPGWIDFTLPTPFTFDSTKSLVVELSGNGGFFVVQNTALSARRIFGAASATTGTVNTGLPEFGFDVQAPTSIGAAADEKVAVVYPNPAANEITIAVPGGRGDGSIRLTDASGRVLLQQNLQQAETTVSVASIPTGLYFYQITDNTGALVGHGKLTVSR